MTLICTLQTSFLKLPFQRVLLRHVWHYQPSTWLNASPPGPLAGEKLPTHPTLFEAAREFMMINLHRLNIQLKQSTSKIAKAF